MRKTSLNFRNGILADERQLYMKVIFNGHQEIDGHLLKNIVIHEASNGQETLTMGSICSNSVKIVMIDAGNIAYFNSEVEVLIGLELETIEWVSMGTFVISEVSRDHDSEVILEGYDHISDLNKDYVPHVDYPCLLSDVVLDIVNQCQLTLKAMTFDEMMIESPVAVTCHEMLSYMASLMGMNVRMNRDNELEFFWYDGSYVIEKKDIFEGGYKITNDVLVISSLTSGSEDHVISCGSGYGITFENPYMNEERLNILYQRINGFSYHPCQVRWRGDPALEVCDLVQLNNENVIIMDQVFSFDGGMSCSLECVGQNEKEVTISKSPTEIKLKKLYHTLLQSFQETTQTLLGQKGGYYTIDYTDGYPSGWTIMNTPTLRDDTHLWKMSMGGFGYSEDGGKTFQNYAFDLNGNLNANALTTGIIQGDGFDLDLESGDIKIGERNVNGEIEKPVLSYSQDKGLYIETFSQIISQVETLSNSIDVSLSSNYVHSQTYDKSHDAYYPDYENQPLKITATIKDRLKNIVDGVYTWKRKGQNDEDYVDLIEGENAVGHILTVSHHLHESVEYKVYVEVEGNGVVFSNEASININVNVLNDVKIEGELCKIEASGTTFIKKDDNYNYSSILLSPHFMQCNFDLWLYSGDLGNTYTIIEPTQLISVGDEVSSHIYETNVVGITYNADNHELQISSDSACFASTNVAVFQLKADIENATDTISITRENDFEAIVNTIKSQIEHLSENYTNIIQDIDTFNGSITNKVEQIETNYNDDIETIHQQLSQTIQTSSSIEEQFTILKKTVENNQEEFKGITTYIQRGDYGIKIGKKEDNIQTLMAPDHFGILFKNGEEFQEAMTLEKNLLTIESIQLSNFFQLGHVILNTKDYGFEMTWGGE